MSENIVFQPMPDLTPDQYEALRSDIGANGVLVPVAVDQHGRIIDGHNRWAIAADLGIDCPTVVLEVPDDDAAMSLAVTLNGARRHLTQDQKRVLIGNELARCPGDSDRAIARRIGCSPTTVGTIRSERRREAEERTAKARQMLSDATTALRGSLLDLFQGGAEPAGILERLAAAREAHGAAARSARADGNEAAVLRHLMAHYMFAATFNDISDVIHEVEACGVTFPLPPVLSEVQIDALLNRAFAVADAEVSNLDTPTAEAVAR